MTAADVFINPKHQGKIPETIRSVMAFQGSKLGMTKKDLVQVAPKLGAQVCDSVSGSDSGSLKKKADEPDVEPKKKSRRSDKSQAAEKAQGDRSRKRKSQAETAEADQKDVD